MTASLPGWYEETLYPDVGQRFRLGEIVYRTGTGLQELVIFENPVLGRVLALDGIIQTSEADEFIYHEMLTHVPILAHGDVRRVLIIGGGDGGMLRRVLEHRRIEKVTMVEIDRNVVDLSIQYLPSISAGAFDDPRTNLVIADGRDFVAAHTDTYDVILVDSTDPAGPAEALFTQDFYADCKKRLTSGGILCTQNGVPFFQPEELRNTHRRFSGLFADAGFFTAAVPTYYGGLMALGWGTDNKALRGQTVEQIRPRAKSANLKARYYTPEVHVGAFALPKFMQDILAS
ncbi:MAG TPA: polyamine aminopropyltransferase [Azospirillaceae bacterium]|nr:polyamine aminopropyltransferase [Azospirillaceae bacterium]